MLSKLLEVRFSRKPSESPIRPQQATRAVTSPNVYHKSVSAYLQNNHHYSVEVARRFDLVNDDVLLDILEELKLAKCLNSFSMTSKRLREASMPILFSICYQRLEYPSTSEDIIPEALWQYIRYG